MRKRPPTKGEHSKEKDKEQSLICYERKKSGYFKSECPQLKKDPKKYKKKTMMVDRKSTRLNSSHSGESRMPSSA